MAPGLAAVLFGLLWAASWGGGDFCGGLATRRAPDWLSIDIANLSGRILSLPTRDQIEVPPFNEALIVEHYSR